MPFWFWRLLGSFWEKEHSRGEERRAEQSRHLSSLSKVKSDTARASCLPSFLLGCQDTFSLLAGWPCPGWGRRRPAAFPYGYGGRINDLCIAAACGLRKALFLSHALRSGQRGGKRTLSQSSPQYTSKHHDSKMLLVGSLVQPATLSLLWYFRYSRVVPVNDSSIFKVATTTSPTDRIYPKYGPRQQPSILICEHA